MTNNEKIARWQGWTSFTRHLDDGPVTQWVSPTGKWVAEPHDYLNDGAAAMSLLPVLVGNGFVGCLNYSKNGYDFSILAENWGRNIVQQPTIAVAISSAILQLIADKP